jgi:hypothetical protein
MSLMLIGTVNLTKVALSFGGEAQNESRYRRLRRFFAQVKMDFDQVAIIVIVLLNINIDEPWILIFDRTRWDLGECANNVLVLSLSLGDIAVPLFWKHIEKRGNSHAHERIELLERFFRVFPIVKIDCVLGDREFASSEFMLYFIGKNIPFCIRVKDNSYAVSSKGRRVRLDSCCRRLTKGEMWYGKKPYILWGNQITLVALKIDGDLVVLATTLNPLEALPLYAKRWEIETSFAALKCRGFCLEDTHMTKPDRIEKWFAILAIAFAWAYRTGQCLEKKKPTPKKNHGRKIMSRFRRGYDCIRQTLFNYSHPLKRFGNQLQQLFKFPLIRPSGTFSLREKGITWKKVYFCPVP